MTEHSDSNQEDARRSRFSGLHSRTFEMELLLSGAVVFGLFQLPPLITPFFDRLLVQLEGHLRLFAIYGQTYFLLLIYGLIGAFLLHLATRAFWIGLVGLESVFPRGVQWDRVKAGPHIIDLGRRKMGTLGRFIDRVDDVCSLIFSFGFMIAMAFVYTVMLIGVCGLAGFVVSKILRGLWTSEQLFWVFFLSVVAVQLVAGLVDRVVGPRVSTTGPLGRLIALFVKISYFMSILRWIGPIQFTLQSHTSNTKVTTTIIAAMMVLLVSTMGILFYQQGILRYDSLVYFPESLREEGLDPRHYRNLHKADSLAPTTPTIQSDVVTDPYLKLSIPYYPRRHNHLIREKCPNVEPFRSPGFSFGRPEPPDSRHARTAVECLASLFHIELDGQGFGNLQFDFALTPDSGLEGIVAFIPMVDLSSGRHELLVIAPPSDRGKPEDRTPIQHLIPFWR